ncbi:sugar transferase [Azotosporobacter soli]|uniref:sugar transferase n=1 Tax=Azotosporobacter soli TaxID=3055040 RepID=UPI0031FEF39F
MKAKRIFDLLLACGALVILAPLLTITALVIKFDSSGPVIFAQRRVGCKGKLFCMYKFRTMRVGTPEVATDQLADAQRHITRSGAFLRKYSIDELPQLLNIIKGDMSLVGPRPALPSQKELVCQRSERGVDVLRPGLTGWAQVNGRDEILLAEKVKLDNEYKVRQSFSFDLYIIWLTVYSVVHGTGVKKMKTAGKVKGMDVSTKGGG